MTTSKGGDAPPASEDRIAVIAAAIVKAYGTDALRVALLQRDLADADTVADWAEIVERLRNG